MADRDLSDARLREMAHDVELNGESVACLWSWDEVVALLHEVMWRRSEGMAEAAPPETRCERCHERVFVQDFGPNEPLICLDCATAPPSSVSLPAGGRK
jgi:hypothetical protein